MNITRTIYTDVLVIGRGAVGLRAAVAAHVAGATTTVAFNEHIGRSGATITNWDTKQGGVTW